MAGKENNSMKEEEEEEDYMADLSLFLPPGNDSSSIKKSRNRNETPQMPKPKKPKGLNWQERKKLEREQKQKEEDERTLAGLEYAIPETNIGFKMLKSMGYNPGSSLGKAGIGRSEPVGLEIRRSREGIGTREEAKRAEKVKEERKVRREEELMEEFGSRKKSQWRSKRILLDYKKAEASLAQLENREIVDPEKDDDGDKEKPEEAEEEEVITEEINAKNIEEVLQAELKSTILDLYNILMKLRDEHRYCLYCGCQYESMEALRTDCPGLYEDDH